MCRNKNRLIKKKTRLSQKMKMKVLAIIGTSREQYSKDFMKNLNQSSSSNNKLKSLKFSMTLRTVLLNLRYHPEHLILLIPQNNWRIMLLNLSISKLTQWIAAEIWLQKMIFSIICREQVWNLKRLNTLKNLKNRLNSRIALSNLKSMLVLIYLQAQMIETMYHLSLIRWLISLKYGKDYIQKILKQETLKESSKSASKENWEVAHSPLRLMSKKDLLITQTIKMMPVIMRWMLKENHLIHAFTINISSMNI